MIGLIGKKIGMTQYYKEDGTLCPTTVIEVGPCPVLQVKSTGSKDGYNAVKLGFWESTKVTKPERGIASKAGVEPVKRMHEFRVENPDEYKAGTVLKADIFAAGDVVMVTGTTKGRGFAGVIKRHKFHGGNDSHGCRSKRVPGSIGSSASPSRVFKGKGMPGHYGDSQFTVRGLEVLKVDPDRNVILVKGAVPGTKKGIVFLAKQG